MPRQKALSLLPLDSAGREATSKDQSPSDLHI